MHTYTNAHSHIEHDILQPPSEVQEMCVYKKECKSHCTHTVNGNTEILFYERERYSAPRGNNNLISIKYVCVFACMKYTVLQSCTFPYEQNTKKSITKIIFGTIYISGHTTINSAGISIKEQILLIQSLPAAQTPRPLKSPCIYTHIGQQLYILNRLMSKQYLI